MKTRKRENGKTRGFLLAGVAVSNFPYERHHCSGWFPMLISLPIISSYFLCKSAPSSRLMYLHFTEYSSQTWVSAASLKLHSSYWQTHLYTSFASILRQFERRLQRRFTNLIGETIFFLREMTLTVRKFPLPLARIACRYQSPNGIGFSSSAVFALAFISR
jgi:hypothetical protein